MGTTKSTELIYDIISLCQILRPLLDSNIDSNTLEALNDLHSNEDLIQILRSGPYNKYIKSDIDAEASEIIHKAAEIIKNKNA